MFAINKGIQTTRMVGLAIEHRCLYRTMFNSDLLTTRPALGFAFR